jgi:hypothetical protein
MRTWAALASATLLGACASQPAADFTVEVPPGVIDQRGRFEEIFCTVLREHGPGLPDYRSCDEALGHVTPRATGTGRAVALAPSERRLVGMWVSGFGYACVERWMHSQGEARDHLRRNGYDLVSIEVEALSGTAANARHIRDALLARPHEPGPPRIVLIGYSKGSSDILEALVSYPEIRERVAAVVSIAGSIGGSPIADQASESLADLLRFFPQSDCGSGDDGAVESLRPEVRKAWLAEHTLPPELRYYTVVTLPDRARISRILVPAYEWLTRFDLRNDGQMLYSDQFVPDSALLAFLNADHWAVALPIARGHPVVSALFVDQNDYPREVLVEAILRFVEEDLSGSGASAAAQGQISHVAF